MVKPALLDHCNTTFMPILNITPLTRHLEFLFVSRDYVRGECEYEQSFCYEVRYSGTYQNMTSQLPVNSPWKVS